MSRIAIIGGHGRVALQLAQILSAEGHDVRSIFRNPDHHRDVAATGATPVEADVEHLSTDQIAAHLAGCDAVVWSAGAGGGNPPRTYAVDRDAAIRSMDAAGEAGVNRYVMVSYIGSRLDHGVPEDHAMFAYAEAKAAADDYLKGTALLWTILAPSALTMDPGTGLIEAGPDIVGSSVPREDVARVAAAVLDRPDTMYLFIPFNAGTTPIAEALDALAAGAR
jgi:uncharacterized protein YbjT (DUF2867 family)